jgi:hypothetical protein
MNRKMVPALLVVSLAGCVSFNPPANPAGPAPAVALPGLKNGWAQPDAFGTPAPAAVGTNSVAAAGGPRPLTAPAVQAVPQRSPQEPLPDAAAMRSVAGKPPLRPAADAADLALALKKFDAAAISYLGEQGPDGSAEESEAGAAPPDKASEESHPAGSPEQDAAALTAPVRRLVNSKSVALDYELKNVGPSGVSAVEVWCTRDGRNWQKQETVAEGKTPITVDVPEEGVYGFSLVARNGVGLGKRPPRAGESPQVVLEVDLTRPAVRLMGVQVDGDAADRRLVVTWRALDRNMGRRPIVLSYAEQAEGPWQPIADGLENSGRYVWKVPAAAPLRFLLRVEATDLAGNVGAAQTASPVLMDQSQPEVSIRTVEPTTSSGRR